MFAMIVANGYISILPRPPPNASEKCKTPAPSIGISGAGALLSKKPARELHSRAGQIVRQSRTTNGLILRLVAPNDKGHEL